MLSVPTVHTATYGGYYGAAASKPWLPGTKPLSAVGMQSQRYSRPGIRCTLRVSTHAK
jgi:hypothetical protein